MSDFLQQVSNFLNLNKLVAVTIPGIVATCALLLFFNPPACTSDPTTCWYCSGQQAKNPNQTTAIPATATRSQGSYLASKLIWAQTDPYKLLHSVAHTGLKDCADVPEYILPTSRMKADKDTLKNLGDLEAVDPRRLLDILDTCNNELSAAQAEMTSADTAEQTTIASIQSEVNTATSTLTTAQTNNNFELIRVYTTRLNAARDRLAAATRLDQSYKSANTAATTLLSQITSIRGQLGTDVSTGVPVDNPAKTPWQTAVQAVGSNVMTFIAVCLIVGQILDPIQRAIVSWDPIRGLTFPFLNSLYRADQPVGMVRFGDQSYQTTRRADVDPMLKKEPHLLDPSYAIGKGLITQDEYGAIQDQYFSQSQITTGMMLPLAMLGGAAYFRLICCNTELGSNWEKFLIATLVSLLLFLLLIGIVVKHLLEGWERKSQANNCVARDAVREALLRKAPPNPDRPCDPDPRRFEFHQELTRIVANRTERGRQREKRKQEQKEKISRLAKSLSEVERRLAGLTAGRAASLSKQLADAKNELDGLNDEFRKWAEGVTIPGPDQEQMQLTKQSFDHRRQRALEKRNDLTRELNLESELREESRRIREQIGDAQRKQNLEQVKEVKTPQEPDPDEAKVQNKEEHDLKEFYWRYLLTQQELGRRGSSLGTLIIGPGLAAGVLALTAVVGDRVLNNWDLAGLAVGVPALEILCFVGGIDRLHNFYSVLHARIIGAAKKQEESQIKKFVDVLTNHKSKQDFFAELIKRREQIDIALNLYGEDRR